MNAQKAFRILFLVFSLFPGGNLLSQVTITPGTSLALTPQQFVETYLAGAGVTISNAQFQNSALPLNSPLRDPPAMREQIGYFSSIGGALAELGIAGGALLSSGKAVNAAAGADPPMTNIWGDPYAPPQEADPDLFILAGFEVHDKSVLEFDFIPQTDVITFRYVFGSEEFDGFCGQNFNDVFGLFLSGPGISGGQGFTNDAVNIALLPNSTNYVTIDNICDADGGKPGMGTYSWLNSDENWYSLNRFTYVFTASYPVTCNQTYHMKFAISDALDANYDSGVFIEQGSFTSNSVTSNVTFSNPLVPQELPEACNTVSLVYSLPQALDYDLPITLTIHPTGLATQADITPNPFPASTIILQGQLQSAPIVISAIADGITEGVENLVIKGSPPVICGNDNTVTNEFFLTDYTPPSASLAGTQICGGNPATLTPVVTGGQPILPAGTLAYLWSTGATTTSITVNPPPGSHLYSVTVTDACGLTASASATVNVGTTPGPAGAVSGPALVCTPATGVVFSIPAITGADAYVWTIPPGAIITAGANTNALTLSFPAGSTSGTVSVYGHSTVCGDGAISSLSVTVHPATGPAGSIAGPAILCQGNSPVIYSIGALPNATSYTWTVPAGVTIMAGAGTPQITCLFTPPAVSGQITVYGENAICGTGTPSVKDITVNPIPGDAGVISAPAGTELCQNASGIPFSITPVPNAAAYNWVFTGTGMTINNPGPSILADLSANATPGTLTVTAVNACGPGAASPPLNLLVKTKPVVTFDICNTVATTKNGRPIVLHGGFPSGNGGVYSGTGVSLAGAGKYVFDPSDNGVTGGTQTVGVPHTVNYRYTNSEGCFDEKSITVNVFASNGALPCPGTVKDQRTGDQYPVFFAGSRCWMASNLNFGTAVPYSSLQTDNCEPEKYCPGNDAAKCALYGGFYQWSEIMAYEDAPGYQDICPPGWHIPTPSEWDLLIAAYSGNGLAGSFLADQNDPAGFLSLPGGIGYLNNQWSFSSGPVTGAMYWTSSPVPPDRATARGINGINSGVSLYSSARANAFPVRCVRN